MPIFSSNGSSLGHFNEASPYTASGETVEVDSTGGSDGGAAIKMTINTNSTEIGVRRNESSNSVRRIRFRYKMDSGATFGSGEHTIMHAWTDAYSKDFVQIRLKQAIGDSSKFRVKIQDAQLPTPGNITTANRGKSDSKPLTKGTWYLFELVIQDGAYHLYIDDVWRMQYKGMTNETYFSGVVHWGKFFSGNMSGIEWYDDFQLDVAASDGSTPATLTGKIAQAWAGWKKRYIRSDGAVVRPSGDGVDDLYSFPSEGISDVVSEGIGYALLFAVQINDQVTFNLVETWAQNNLERRLNSMTKGQYMMGWHYRDHNNSMHDWNFATDADIDRLVALYWAHERWGSGGAVNYLSRANLIATDFKNWVLRRDSSLSQRIQATDEFQSTGTADEADNPNAIEINASYIAPYVWPVVNRNNADSAWQQAIDGSYTLLQKATDNAGGLPTTAGLPPNWCEWKHDINDVAARSGRDDYYTYDAFRSPLRWYMDYKFNARTAARDLSSGAIGTFFKNEWNSRGKILAEYLHNGDPRFPENLYEKAMMTFVAYLTLLAAADGGLSGAQTAADAMWANKISDSLTYRQDYNGSYFADNHTSTGVDRGSSSYYNDSWMLWQMMLKNNQFTDPPSGPPVENIASSDIYVAMIG